MATQLRTPRSVSVQPHPHAIFIANRASISVYGNGSEHTEFADSLRLHGGELNTPVKSPPASSEDLLFSDPASPGDGSAAGGHASSSGSGMSEERNADSVLFNVDTLKQQQPNRQGAPRQLARLAAATPASEGSGLIDVKTLASGATPAASEPDPAAAESTSSSSSTSSSASALLSGGSALGTIPTPGARPAASAAPPSRVPLIVLSVLAVLALAAAVTAIVLRG